MLCVKSYFSSSLFRDVANRGVLEVVEQAWRGLCLQESCRKIAMALLPTLTPLFLNVKTLRKSRYFVGCNARRALRLLRRAFPPIALVSMEKVAALFYAMIS